MKYAILALVAELAGCYGPGPLDDSDPPNGRRRQANLQEGGG